MIFYTDWILFTDWMFHLAGTVAFSLWVYGWVKRSMKKPEDFS